MSQNAHLVPNHEVIAEKAQIIKSLMEKLYFLLSGAHPPEREDDLPPNAGEVRTPIVQAARLANDIVTFLTQEIPAPLPVPLYLPPPTPLPLAEVLVKACVLVRRPKKGQEDDVCAEIPWENLISLPANSIDAGENQSRSFIRVQFERRSPGMDPEALYGNCTLTQRYIGAKDSNVPLPDPPPPVNFGNHIDANFSIVKPPGDFLLVLNLYYDCGHDRGHFEARTVTVYQNIKSWPPGKKKKKEEGKPNS